MALLEIQDLRTTFFTPAGPVRAVDGVSLRVESGKTLGLVGESGCGKSVTALSILGLVPPPGRVVAGRIWFEGKDLTALPPAEMRRLRGDAIGMIFQEPMTSLNPVFTVGNQIAESLRIHRGQSRREAWKSAIELLRLVGIPGPERRVAAYPHQLSGGMRQRVMIAIAISCRPRLLIADEPTTALDVTIQAEILDLLADLQRRFGMALLLVTHDLGIVAERTDEVAVMYAGRVVETAPVEEIFRTPLHPYTRGLLRSVPKVGTAKQRRLDTIPGVVPNLLRLPSGCRFRDRCPIAVSACAEIDPALEAHRPGHRAACIRAGEADSLRLEAAGE